MTPKEAGAGASPVGMQEIRTGGETWGPLCFLLVVWGWGRDLNGKESVLLRTWTCRGETMAGEGLGYSFFFSLDFLPFSTQVEASLSFRSGGVCGRGKIEATCKTPSFLPEGTHKAWVLRVWAGGSRKVEESFHLHGIFSFRREVCGPRAAGLRDMAATDSLGQEPWAQQWVEGTRSWASWKPRVWATVW